MIVYRQGTILTQEPDNPVVEALAYDGDELVAVGDERSVLARAGEGADIRSLDGATLLPGFIDAHHHLSLAVLYASALDCSGALVRSIPHLLDRLRSAAAKLPEGRWLIARSFDERAMAERRAPTARELDSACPGHPVVIMHYTFHACVVSGLALEAMNIGRGASAPHAGTIGRDRHGTPNGLLIEAAMAPAECMAQDALLGADESFEVRLARHEDALFATGITRVADATVPPVLELLYRDLQRRGALRVAVVMLPVGEQGYLTLPEDRLEGAPTGEGDDALMVGPLKLFGDGADACAVAMSVKGAARGFVGAMRDVARNRSWASIRGAARFRFRLERDLRLHTGVRFLTHPRAAALARRATERGFTLAIHAVGNEAFNDAVRLIEGVRKSHRDVPPPRIEHAVIVDLPWLRRAADAGIQLVCQPTFLRFAEGAELGVPHMSFLPLRSAIEAGLRPAGSSDYPVTDFDPMLALRVAISRRWDHGPVIHADQALSPEDVLDMYTRQAAHACGCLDRVGTLAVGKRADLVILSSDPRRDFDATVLETVIAGQTVFRRHSPPKADRP